MHRYIIKRLLMMIPVIIGVSFLVFFIMDLAPGDAVDLMAPEGATTEELAEIRHDLGLDKPVVLRYADYMIECSMVIWAFLMCQRPMCFPHM